MLRWGGLGTDVCLWDNPAPQEMKTMLVVIYARRLNLMKLTACEVCGLITLCSPWPLHLDKLTMGDTIKISNLSTQN